MIFSKKYYDLGQWIIRVLVPAFIALYMGIDALVNLPKENEVTGILALVATFLGVLLASSSASFKRNNEVDGGLVYQQGIDPETGIAGLGFFVNKLPNELLSNKTVTFHVRQPPENIQETHYPGGLPRPDALTAPAADVDPRSAANVPVEGAPQSAAPPWEKSELNER
jgi:hypothetical protein